MESMHGDDKYERLDIIVSSVGQVGRVKNVTYIISNSNNKM